MSLPADKSFFRFVEDRYKGKVFRIARSTHLDPTREHIVVQVEFHIPVDEADELEMYKRINRVIEVIADGETNNVR